MSWVADVLDGLGVTGRDHGTSFPDGAAFRIEIPSVEGPKVLEAVLRAAEAEGITVNRVSQGSGAVLMRAAELRDMAQVGLEAGVEVCLFVGPRERYGVGAHARSEDGRAHGDQVSGLRQISYALEDVLRATEEGIRSFLVADLGLLRAVTQAQAQGSLPAGLVWKVSAAMSPSNPVTVKLLEGLGASTVNIPADRDAGRTGRDAGRGQHPARPVRGVPRPARRRGPRAGAGRPDQGRGAAVREVRAAQRPGRVSERAPPGGGGLRERDREGAPSGGGAGVAGTAARPRSVQAGGRRARRSGPMSRAGEVTAKPARVRDWLDGSDNLAYLANPGDARRLKGSTS